MIKPILNSYIACFCCRAISTEGGGWQDAKRIRTSGKKPLLVTSSRSGYTAASTRYAGVYIQSKFPD